MKKVVVGMSGGVDSSVAALLLKEQGYDVVGVTMEMWDGMSVEEQNAEPPGGCGGSSAAEDAARVAEAIGIPHVVMNFQDVFREKVCRYFVDEYVHGRTPNPCVVCNRFVKWEALLEQSIKLGADRIATGHYARIAKLPNGRYSIRNSVTAAKDQTYALFGLTQDQLKHTLMPVGEYEKPRIREIAEQAGLPVAHKPDSQDICFIPDHDYAAYVRKHTAERLIPGSFVNAQGEILGRHRGIIHYTVGQRKGLGITFGHPVFVTEIRPETNEVVLGDAGEVFSEHLICDTLNFMSIPDLTGEQRVLAKIRYSHRGTWCTVRRIDADRAECLFEEPVRAVTPGQPVVFYDGDLVMGGGRIVSR